MMAYADDANGVHGNQMASNDDGHANWYALKNEMPMGDASSKSCCDCECDNGNSYAMQ